MKKILPLSPLLTKAYNALTPEWRRLPLLRERAGFDSSTGAWAFDDLAWQFPNLIKRKDVKGHVYFKIVG